MKAVRPASDGFGTGSISSGAALAERRELPGNRFASVCQTAVHPEAIAAAIDRLVEQRSLDDRRTARAVARSEAAVRHRGSQRVLARLLSIGIDRDLARETVREIFGDLDEGALMERALAKRLRTAASPIRDAAHHRRLHAFLVRQGFPSSAVAALLRARAMKAGPRPDD